MKEYARKFYSSGAWKQCRAAYMKSVGGLCEDCLANGIIRPADTVHHIIHITPKNINDPGITLSFDNLRAVCRDCHAKEHGNLKRYKVDEFGRVTIR